MTAVTLPARPLATPAADIAPATQAAIDPSTRTRGRRGPNATLLRVELSRTLASPRRMLMAIGLPVALSLAMNQASLRNTPYGLGSVAAMVMVGMALYGASVSTSATGAAVSIERASGWTRQLRLTPLNPLAYIATKSLVGLLQGGLAVVAVLAVAIATGNHLPWQVALASGAIAWLGSGLFAAYGLFLGYLVPTDNAMQINGLSMAAFAMLGGVFMPVQDGLLGTISKFTPMWGVHQLVLTPFHNGDFSWTAVANLVVWFVAFTGGATCLMSRDTKRV